MVSIARAARVVSENIEKGDEVPDYLQYSYKKKYNLTMATMSNEEFEKLSKIKIRYGVNHQFLVIDKNNDNTVSLIVRASLHDIKEGKFLLPNIFGEANRVCDTIGCGIYDIKSTNKGDCFFVASKIYDISKKMRNDILQSAYKKDMNQITETISFEEWLTFGN